MLAIGLTLLCLFPLFSQEYTLSSPDQNLSIVVTVNSTLSWSASLKGKTVVENATIGMDFSKATNFGEHPKVIKNTSSKHNAVIHSGISHKNAEIKDEYSALSLTFKGGYEVHFRAYNDGVAYQFVDKKRNKREVVNEKLSLQLPEGSTSLFPKEDSMYSHNERFYVDTAVKDIKEGDFCSLPVLFTTKHAKIVFTETALTNYPGMFLEATANHELAATFPPYVLEAVDSDSSPDRNQNITTEADYIATTEGKRAYPWRVFIISDDDKTFVESNLTYQLAKPQEIENTSWITPGKVAWDWYNANNIYGVDFEAGLNTPTYKYYIDFAAANHIEYVILDEGWTKSTTEILDFNPDINVPELIAYGKEKGVELILWVLWKPLDQNLTEILETYKSWGVKGIKVDFIQRNDQYVVQSYERIAKECARLELLVDFHGAFKPSGLRRMYPNVINYEGVKGNENNKWSADITPEHNVTIPFIRMAAGPMDFTPGAMINTQEINYAVSFDRPMSMGTRAHQVAMYVIYEAPLQMMCESPSRYYKEQETVDFITQIPTVWDKTKVLQAAVGDYLAVARKKDDIWYLGAMTDWTARTLPLDFSFLEEGTYTMEVFKDGKNANTFAEDYSKETIEVTKNTILNVSLAKGGGYSAIITKK